VRDFSSSLGALGGLTGFVPTGQQKRGGMVLRVYRASFANRSLRVWTYETPDGKLELYQVAPQGQARGVENGGGRSMVSLWEAYCQFWQEGPALVTSPALFAINPGMSALRSSPMNKEAMGAL
jgi:hypothetical protein